MVTVKNDSEATTGIPRESCTRCGICCEKGGPAFHAEDRYLIDKGIIHTRHLYTIRRGEWVHDNVRDQTQPSDSEMIKIKGQGGSWTCHFFNTEDKRCTIYAQRPLECRTLQCWNTAALEKIYDRNRLTRRDLLVDIAGLWELVEEHERHCAAEKLKSSLDDLEGSFQKAAIKAVITMVRYDQEIRRMVTSQGGVEPDMLEFLFGRPAEKTIGMFGYRLGERDGHYSLIKQ